MGRGPGPGTPPHWPVTGILNFHIHTKLDQQYKKNLPSNSPLKYQCYLIKHTLPQELPFLYAIPCVARSGPTVPGVPRTARPRGSGPQFGWRYPAVIFRCGGLCVIWRIWAARRNSKLVLGRGKKVRLM